MALYEYNGKRPKVGATSFVHELANVVGDVEIGENCFIGAGATLRGDYGPIRVGDNSSVQECCVMHTTINKTCAVGNNCTIGHGAVLHGCTVEDGSLVGMNSVVTDGSVVGAGSVVAEGAVLNGKETPPRKIVAGVPAKEIGDVSDGRLRMMELGNKMYVELTKKYVSEVKRID